MNNIIRNNVLTKDSTFNQLSDKLEAHIDEINSAMKDCDEVKLLRLYSSEVSTCQSILSSVSKIQLFYLKLARLEG
jgi:hypothetical protein